MSAPIGPGDWVRCINASCDPYGKAVPLIEGEVYRVAEIHRGLPHGTIGNFWTDDAFDLEGVPDIITPEGDRLAYGAYRFRPLGGSDDQTLLESAPERATEDA